MPIFIAEEDEYMKTASKTFRTSSNIRQSLILEREEHSTLKESSPFLEPNFTAQ